MIDQGDIFKHFLARASRQPFHSSRIAGCFQQWDAVGVSIFVEHIDGLAADASGRCVDRPHHGLIVLGIVHQLAIRQHVLDFFTLVKLLTTNHLIRHASLAELAFERARQGIHTIQNRKVARPVGAALDRLGNSRGDTLGFIVLTRVFDKPHRGSFIVVGEQRLLLAPQVVADEIVSDPQNLFCTAIVLLQAHDLHLGKVILELQNVVDVGSTPTVDRLIRVTSHRQIRIVDRQCPQHDVLHMIRVLVFIHKQILKPLIEFGPHFRILIKQLRDVQQQVIKVNSRRRKQPLLIKRINFGHDLAQRTAGTRLELIGRDQLVLRAADRVSNPLGRVM